MTIQYSDTVRNAKLDAIESTIGAAPILRIYASGSTPPADETDAVVGTVLVEITLPSDWLAAADGGSKAKAGTWAGTGAAAGTADYFRIYNSGDTVSHVQGTVTATGGGGDLTLDNTSIASGQSVTISTFTITDNNG